jgi:hypothetical protein
MLERETMMCNTYNEVFQCYTDGKLDSNEEHAQIDYVRLCRVLLHIIEDLAKEVCLNTFTADDAFQSAAERDKFGSGRYNLPSYWEPLWWRLTMALERSYKKRGWECHYYSRPWHDPDYEPIKPEQIYEEDREIAQECLDKIAQLNGDWPSVAGTESIPSMFPCRLSSILLRYRNPSQ